MKGDEFLRRKQYTNAELCYERAGDQYNVTLCRAYIKEESAIELSNKNDDKKACVTFHEAAQLFLSLKTYQNPAADCFYKAKRYKEAAELYRELQLFKRAAISYEAAHMYELAATSYFEDGNIDSALRCCYLDNLFEMAIGFIKHKEKINSIDVFSELYDCYNRSAKYYHKFQRFDKMKESVMNFPDVFSRRVFLRRYKHFDLMLEVEISSGCYKEAGEIFESQGKYLDAAQTYAKATVPCYESEAKCLLKYVALQSFDPNYRWVDPSSKNNQFNKIYSLVDSCSNGKKILNELRVYLAKPSLSEIPSIPNLLQVSWKLSFILIDKLFTSNRSAIPLVALYDVLYHYIDIIEMSNIVLDKAKTQSIHTLPAKDIDVWESILQFFFAETNGADINSVNIFTSPSNCNAFKSVLRSFNGIEQKYLEISKLDFCVNAKQILNRKLSDHVKEIIDSYMDQLQSLNESKILSERYKIHWNNFLLPKNSQKPGTISKYFEILIKIHTLSSRKFLFYDTDKILQDINERIFTEILFRPPLTVEDLQNVEIFRFDKTILGIFRDILAKKIMFPDSVESYAVALLATDISQTKINETKRLSQQLKNRIIETHRLQYATDNDIIRYSSENIRGKLLYACQWEEGVVNNPSEYIFKPAADVIKCLIEDVLQGNLKWGLSLYELKFPRWLNRNVTKPKPKPIELLSPILFISYLEKAFVCMLLTFKNFRLVFIPTILATLVLTKKSKNFKSALDKYISEQDQAISRDSNFWLNDASFMILQLLQSINEETLTGKFIKREGSIYQWMGSDDCAKSFIMRLAILPLLYANNLAISNDKRSNIIQNMISIALQKPKERSQGFNVLTSLPHFFSHLINRICANGGKDLFDNISQYCIDTRDKMAAVDCCDNITLPYFAMNRGISRLVVYGDDEDIIRIRPVVNKTVAVSESYELKGPDATKDYDDNKDNRVIVDAAPPELIEVVDKMDKYHKVLLQILDKVRLNLSKFSPIDKVSRQLEQGFLAIDRRPRNSSLVREFCAHVAPVIVEIQSIIHLISASIKELKSVKVRCLIYFMYFHTCYRYSLSVLIFLYSCIHVSKHYFFVINWGSILLIGGGEFRPEWPESTI